MPWDLRLLCPQFTRASVNRFEDRILLAHVRAGRDPEAANQACGKIRNYVAVKIRQQQNVESFGTHHKLHGGIIDDQLSVLELG